jgi:hypothetical protein
VSKKKKKVTDALVLCELIVSARGYPIAQKDPHVYVFTITYKSLAKNSNENSNCSPCLFEFVVLFKFY